MIVLIHVMFHQKLCIFPLSMISTRGAQGKEDCQDQWGHLVDQDLMAWKEPRENQGEVGQVSRDRKEMLEEMDNLDCL